MVLSNKIPTPKKKILMVLGLKVFFFEVFFSVYWLLAAFLFFLWFGFPKKTFFSLKRGVSAVVGIWFFFIFYFGGGSVFLMLC